MKGMATRMVDKTKTETAGGKPSASLIGILIVQLIIGYQWLLSGIAKIAEGNFASGLANDLTEASAGTAGWYAAFLNSSIIPNATAFGYIIEYAEVLGGLALIAGALVLVFAWSRSSYGLRTAIVILMIAASVGGIFMAVNFHIASGSNHPWRLPDSAFDEAVDIDMLMTAIQTVITVVLITVLKHLRQERIASSAIPANVQTK
jgi:uncharacterized membrane protein YphA (DoxX/SURF4 family)